MGGCGCGARKGTQALDAVLRPALSGMDRTNGCQGWSPARTQTHPAVLANPELFLLALACHTPFISGKHTTLPKSDAARRPDFSVHAPVSYNRDRLSKVSGRTLPFLIRSIFVGISAEESAQQRQACRAQ